MVKSKHKNSPDFWKLARSFLHEYMPKVRKLSEKSIETYKHSLNAYLNYLQGEFNIERPDITFEDFSRKNLKSYITWMSEEKGYSAKSVNIRITAIKSFLNYSSEEDITLVTFYNDARCIKGIKNSKKPIIYLSRDAITTLLGCTGTSTVKERRNRMLLILMYDSAARVQELADLTLADLHVNEKHPFITLTGKGGKTRNVPLMNKTVKHLELYISEFHTLTENRSLFYSMRDGMPHALSTDSISLILKKTADKARQICSGMPEDIHCHLIRKTRAMDLYQQGISLPIVMQILGHESMSTTSTFYAFATVEMMHDAIAKANPSAVGELPKWKNKKFMQALYSLD